MDVINTVPFNEYVDLKREVDYLRSLVSELSDKLNIIDKQDNKEFKVKSIFVTRHLTTSSQQKQKLEVLKNYLRESIVLLEK